MLICECESLWDGKIIVLKVMQFKGHIYITDPSYIAKRVDWANDNGFDSLGETIELPEFTDFLLKSTGIGDGSWKVYELYSATQYSFADICKIIEKRDFNECSVIGEFCVDSATACVVYQHEADVYNSYFKKEFKDKLHCWALIKDFDGKIEAYYDSEGELHFIGIGNRCFFSA